MIYNFSLIKDINQIQYETLNHRNQTTLMNAFLSIIIYKLHNSKNKILVSPRQFYRELKYYIKLNKYNKYV